MNQEQSRKQKKSNRHITDFLDNQQAAKTLQEQLSKIDQKTVASTKNGVVISLNLAGAIGDVQQKHQINLVSNKSMKLRIFYPKKFPELCPRVFLIFQTVDRKIQFAKDYSCFLNTWNSTLTKIIRKAGQMVRNILCRSLRPRTRYAIGSILHLQAFQTFDIVPFEVLSIDYRPFYLVFQQGDFLIFQNLGNIFQLIIAEQAKEIKSIFVSAQNKNHCFMEFYKKRIQFYCDKQESIIQNITFHRNVAKETKFQKEQRIKSETQLTEMVANIILMEQMGMRNPLIVEYNRIIEYFSMRDSPSLQFYLIKLQKLLNSPFI